MKNHLASTHIDVAPCLRLEKTSRICSLKVAKKSINNYLNEVVVTRQMTINEVVKDGKLVIKDVGRMIYAERMS